MNPSKGGDRVLARESEMLAAQTRSEVDGGAYSGTLTTDDRVLARVTDGIYRQPGSALRELVSNAWDADATEVVIRTDAPRFAEIEVSDNGNGMDWPTLARALHHIGGSAKRLEIGADYGISADGMRDKSPGGRSLIGKIGIGLFSVAQLTRRFQVITKRKGEAYWNVAVVDLNTHSDTRASSDGDSTYQAGSFDAWRERTSENAAHGTTILLTGIWPQTIETLRSSDLWARLDEASEQGTVKAGFEPPMFNIGAVTNGDQGVLRNDKPRYPWRDNCPESQKMHEYLRSVVAQFETGRASNPALSRMCDYYLRMIWQLATWSPLHYVERDPLDLTATSGYRFFSLTDRGAEEAQLESGQTCRDLLSSHGMEREFTFGVTIDGIELRRPVQVDDPPRTSAALQTPMLFVGEGGTDFSNADITLSGGPVKFYAYFQWLPKISPVENRGVVVRVKNASGSDYDATFLNFPVAEQRRLEQLTCEVFVTEGLDGALNIDRESLNTSHPHVVYLTRWVHRQLRAIIAKHKQLGSAQRKERKAVESGNSRARLDMIIAAAEARAPYDRSEEFSVSFTDPAESSQEPRSKYTFDRNAVLGSGVSAKSSYDLEAKLGAITELLEIHGLLAELSDAQAENVLAGIRRVLTMEVES